MSILVMSQYQLDNTYTTIMYSLTENSGNIFLILEFAESMVRFMTNEK